MSSFLKKEISFSRRPKADVEPEERHEREEREERVPFWKKEISLGRGEKAPRPTRAEKRAKPRAEKRDGEEKQQPKGPWAKSPKAKSPKAKSPKGRGGKNSVVGLKIGASQIAAARVANNGTAELVQLAREPLAPGLVVGGELQDAEALADALKAFFKKHKLPTRGVRLGVANNRIGVRIFELEGIDDPKQLANAIRFRAQEVLPIPVDEAVLDYRVLDEREDENGAPVRRVLLVVAYRDLVDRYVEACRKAGLRLVGIDLEAFALLRALGAPPDEEQAEAATVAVAVGHDRSILAVSDGRVCEFTRVLNWGGGTVDATVAETLELDLAQAEAVKRALSLGDEVVPQGLTAKQASDAREAIRRTVWAFARELVSSLQFYQSQPGSLEISGITVTGGTAHLPGLADELGTLIGVPVSIGNPLGRVRVRDGIDAGEQVGSLAVAIGLGIDD